MGSDNRWLVVQSFLKFLKLCTVDISSYNNLSDNGFVSGDGTDDRCFGIGYGYLDRLVHHNRNC